MTTSKQPEKKNPLAGPKIAKEQAPASSSPDTPSGDTSGFLWPKMALDSMSEAIVVFDLKSRIVFANTIARQYAEIPLESPGPLFKDVFSIQSPHGTFPSSRIFGRERTPRHFRSATVRTNRGMSITAEASFEPIFDESSAFAGCVFRFRDIGAALAEERLASERQKLDAMANFALGIAPEFANLLTTIAGHASAILDNLIPKTRAHDEAQQIVSTLDKAGSLLQRIQSLSRIADQKSVDQTELILVEGIVADAVNVIKTRVPAHKISFLFRQPVAKLHVRAERGLLLVCLVNVLLNAAEALPDGSEITLDVSETAVSGRKFALLRIHDNGKGIPKEIQEKIFEPLFTTKRNAPSAAGLGLTIVKSSINKWGGFIKIRSRVGYGTTVKIFVPLAETPQPKAEVKCPLSSVGSVLIVDDDSELLHRVAAEMRRAGYKVIEALNADEALDQFKQHQAEISLAVIDMILSGKDGKYVLDEILRKDPAAKTIITSGFCKDYVRSYLQGGSWMFLQKPYESHQLISMVCKAFESQAALPCRDIGS